MIGMGKLGDVFVEIIAKDDAFQQKISRLGQTVGSVAIGNLLSAGISRAAGEMSGLVQQGFAYNAQIRQSTISFEVLLGSLEKSKLLMEQIEKFGEKTPLTTPDLTKGATALIATKKIKSGEIMPILEKLADASAGSSEGFSSFPRVTRAISQMLTKGKIQAEEMMQMSEAGVPAWDALAKAMGKSTAEVQRMGQAGLLGKREIMMLIDELGKIYKGMAEKQSQSLPGLMSTLQDKIKKMMGDATKPLYEFAESSLKKIIAAMDSPKIRQFIDTIADGIGQAIQYGKEFVNSPLAQTIASFAKITLGVGAVLGGVSLLGGAITTAFAYAPLATFVAGLVGLTKLLERVFTGPESQKFQALWERGRDLVVEIGRNVSDMLAPALERVGFFMEAAFGEEGSYQTSFNSFLESALGGLNEMLDVVSLLTTDWDTTCEIMETSWDLLLVNMGEAFDDFVNDFTKGMKDGLKVATGQMSLDELMQSLTKGTDWENVGVGQSPRWNNPARPQSPEAQALLQRIDELMDRAVGIRQEKRFERDAQDSRRLMDEIFNKKKSNPLDDPFSDESIAKNNAAKFEKLMQPFLAFAEGAGMFIGAPSAQETKRQQTQFVGLTDFGKRIQESLGRDTKEKQEARRMKLAEEQNKKLGVIQQAATDTVTGIKDMVGALKSSFGFDD